MNEDQILSTILPSTFTKAHCYRRLRLWREFLEHKFFKGEPEVKIEDFLREENASQSDLDTLSSLGGKFYHLFTRENIYKILNNLSDNLKKLPVVTVFLPNEPTEREIVNLGKWFRKHLDPYVIMDLRLDPKLHTGCAFVWNGVYHNFSLRFYLDKEKKRVLQIIEEYAQNKKSSQK